jgi:hypothetical protein
LWNALLPYGAAGKRLPSRANEHPDDEPGRPGLRGEVTARYRSRRKRRFDLGSQEVEVELGRLVRIRCVKAQPFPPGASSFGEGGHDERAACRLLVQLHRRGSAWAAIVVPIPRLEYR